MAHRWSGEAGWMDLPDDAANPTPANTAKDIRSDALAFTLISWFLE
jgi:hypothetical protein